MQLFYKLQIKSGEYAPCTVDLKTIIIIKQCPESQAKDWTRNLTFALHGLGWSP